MTPRFVLARISMRDIAAHKRSALLGSISMVACIAFITAVLIVSATVRHSFDGLFATTYANSNVVVRSANKVEGEFGRDNRDDISDALIPVIASVRGVSEAVGAIEGKALISTLDGVSAQPNDDLPEYGGIYVPSVLTPWQLLPGGRAPHGPSEVVVDRGAARFADIHVGDTVRVTTRVGPMRYTVVGIAAFAGGSSAGGATWALFDQATAEQVVSGAPGLLDEIRVRGDGTLDDAALATAVRTALDAVAAGAPASSRPADAAATEVLTGDAVTVETQGALGRTVDLFTSLALLFAAVATIAGSFVIAASLATSAARRQAQHGLLRVVGATRRQIAALTVIEAVALGIVGAIGGFFAGIGLAHLVARFLSSIGFGLPSTAFVIRPVVVLIDIATGVVVSVGAGAVAASKSSKAPPSVAVRAEQHEPALRAGRRWALATTAFAVAGIAFAWAASQASSAWLLVSLVALAAAVIGLGPLAVRSAAGVVGRGRTSRFVSRWLGARAVAGRPRRFALGANAVMIAAALVVATSTIGASANASLFDNFDDQISGDFLVSSTKASQQLDGIFPQALLTEIAALPQVAHAAGIGYERFTALDRDGQPTRQVARVVDPTAVGGLVDLGFESGSLQTLTPDGVLLSTGKARRDGLRLGDPVTVTLLNGEVHTLHVEGLFTRDDLTDQVLDIRLFATQSKPVDFGLIVVTKRPDSGAEATASALRTLVADYATAQVQTRRQFLAGQNDQVEQYLHIVDALVALSIFVAIAGVGTMLMLSVGERGRELALLRITGMTAGQVRRSVAWESLVTCTLGAVEGVLVGAIGGWAFVRVLRDRGLHHLSIPLGSIVVVIVASLAVGVLASVWPARRATGIDALSEMTAQ